MRCRVVVCTTTTTVLSILSLTTVPTRAFRCPVMAYDSAPAAAWYATASCRSRWIVLMRAMRWRSLRGSDVLAICRVVTCIRAVKSWRWVSSRSFSKSASDMFRSSPVSSFRFRLRAILQLLQLTCDEARLDRQLVRGQAHRFARCVLAHAGHFEQHAAAPHHGHPELGRALAAAHARFGRLLGDRLVREDADPHIAAALHRVRHGAPRGLDLAGGDPGVAQRLEAELAKRDLVAGVGHAPPSPPVRSAPLDPL